MDKQSPTTRAFPRIRVRPVHDDKIGVTISDTEYCLTISDAAALQDAITYARVSASLDRGWEAVINADT
jgi:hypothetical protein